MHKAKPRRRALCVRPQLNESAAPFLQKISDEWVHALALHCDVSIVDSDFDFKKTCDRVKPDFVIFDAVHWVRPHRITVTNADAYPDIPRAFYFNCDPHDPMRPQVLEMLHGYGVDTIFCGVEHLQQMPELSRFTCFVIPLFVESEIFRDYGLEKTIPVSIFGGHLFPTFYPWRAQVTDEIQKYIPTLVYPHPGYTNGGANPFEARDEKYARLLSASAFSIADTTRLDYVVRKHLEIPASGAILVAPDSDVVKAYGFVDLKNCILGEGTALYQKMLSVAANPSLYEQIRTSGRDLIHKRYTRAHWTHIVDWFECRTIQGDNETTQQVGRFGKFRNVPLSPQRSSVEGLSFGSTPMSTVLDTAAVTILTGGNLDTEKARLLGVLQWIGHIAEPHFLLGVISMLQGNLTDGLAQIGRRGGVQVGNTPGVDRYNFGHLDPCELSWLLLIAAITGDGDLGHPLLERAKTTPHVSVRRAVWILSGSPHDIHFGEAGLMAPQPGDCPSIHWLGQESFPQWLLMVSRLLATCNLEGASDFMRIIAEAFDESDAGEGAVEFREAC